VYGADGKLMKVKIQMCPVRFADGTPQELYFPDGHDRAGIFKGMAVILEERGFRDMSKVRAECPGFKCKPEVINCCCRHILYNQPDFVDVESLLESACKSHGFQVLFLPKFHCELNFIEQCWGHAKRLYWMKPPSSKEEDLQANVLASLKAIPLVTMRWCVLLVS